jgi:hypothetical protein
LCLNHSNKNYDTEKINTPSCSRRDIAYPFCFKCGRPGLEDRKENKCPVRVKSAAALIDFSTGVLLEFKGGTLPNALKAQGIDLHMPWTTGFGVGYRLTEWLNIRIEPKWHRFEYYYDDESKYQASEITSYNTFTLGLGLYGSYQPFKNKENFLKGIMIAPSIRYWPTIASSLKGNQFTYADQHTGADETIKTYGPGIGLTPLVINVSVGYSFHVKNKP